MKLFGDGWGIRPSSYTALVTAVSGSHAYYLRISYDSRTSTFVIRRPVGVHEIFKSRVVSWIHSRLDAIADSGAQSGLFVQKILCRGSATLLIEPPAKERVVIRHDPDSQFAYTRRYWPSVVIELANSPGPKSLSRLANDYILESRGNIRAFVGFELDMGTKRVSLTVWRPHFYIHPQKGLPTVGVQSETQVSSLDYGTEGSMDRNRSCIGAYGGNRPSAIPNLNLQYHTGLFSRLSDHTIMMIICIFLLTLLQVLRDEHGTPNPAEGSGLRLTLSDFAPKDLVETVDPDVSLLIDSAKLCEFLGEVEESERIRAEGPIFTPREMNLVLKWRETTPEPAYEEDEFVFGEE